VTALVELPPLDANTTFVVKLPTLSGVKLMTRLLCQDLGRCKGCPMKS